MNTIPGIKDPIPQDQRPIRLLIIGDSGVGKSMMLLRFTDDAFTPEYITTIGIDFKIKTVYVDNIKYKLQVWDTAGQERFRTITKNYFRGAMGIIVVYDVTNRKSFESVTRWMNDIYAHCTDTVSIVLVGNKIDIRDAVEVKESEGKGLAESKNIPFFACSSKEGTNIDNMFDYIVKDVIKIYGLGPNATNPKPGKNTTSQRIIVADKPTKKEDSNCC